MPNTVLITGANRGIGLALAQRYLATGRHIVATARNPEGARDLWELERDYPGKVRLAALDVASDADCRRLAKELTGIVLDVLVNNAGVALGWETPLAKVSDEDLRRMMEVNAFGPLRMTRAFLPHLLQSQRPTAVVISSSAGSITNATSPSAWGYRMSKSAANMFAKLLAIQEPNIISVTLSPGWVRTEMGGMDAPLSPAQSAEGLVQVIDGLTKASSGKFFNYNGQSVPW